MAHTSDTIHSDDTFAVKCDWKKYIRKIHNLLIFDYDGIVISEKTRNMRLYNYKYGMDNIAIRIHRIKDDCFAVYSFIIMFNDTVMVSYSSYSTRSIYKNIKKILTTSMTTAGTTVFKTNYSF